MQNNLSNALERCNPVITVRRDPMEETAAIRRFPIENFVQFHLNRPNYVSLVLKI